MLKLKAPVCVFIDVSPINPQSIIDVIHFYNLYLTFTENALKENSEMRNEVGKKFENVTEIYT